MKVMVLLKHLGIGGTERRLYNIIKFLDKHDWYVCYETEMPFKYNFSSLKQVKLIQHINNEKRFLRFFRDNLPDIFIFYASNLPNYTFRAIPKPDLDKVKVFYTLGTTSHVSLEPYNRNKKYINKAIVVSRQLQKMIENSVYIPTGVDLKEFKFKDRFNINEVRFGYIGRIARKKRVEFIPLALKGYVDTFFVGGTITDKECYNNLQLECKKQGIKLVYLGESIYTQKLLDEIDVLIHYSEREGMPNIILEASACGVATIATQVGDLIESEFLDNYHIKYINSLEQLSFAIRYFQENPQEVYRIGFNAYSLVKRKRTAEKMARRWDELFKS